MNLLDSINFLDCFLLRFASVNFFKNKLPVQSVEDDLKTNCKEDAADNCTEPKSDQAKVERISKQKSCWNTNEQVAKGDKDCSCSNLVPNASNETGLDYLVHEDQVEHLERQPISLHITNDDEIIGEQVLNGSLKDHQEQCLKDPGNECDL